MNRRDLFKGLAAALVAANIPFPIEQLIDLPQPDTIKYLNRVRVDLINLITRPPCTLHEDGRLEIMSVEHHVEALGHVNKLIKELSV